MLNVVGNSLLIFTKFCTWLGNMVVWCQLFVGQTRSRNQIVQFLILAVFRLWSPCFSTDKQRIWNIAKKNKQMLTLYLVSAKLIIEIRFQRDVKFNFNNFSIYYIRYQTIKTVHYSSSHCTKFCMQQRILVCSITDVSEKNRTKNMHTYRNSNCQSKWKMHASKKCSVSLKYYLQTKL